MMDVFPKPLRVFVLIASGALCLASVQDAAEAFVPREMPILWWAGRAWGLLAYVALWLSALFGVLISSKSGGGLFDPAWLVALHHRWAMASVVSTSLHVLAILADKTAGVTPLAVAVPLVSDRLRGPVALGTLALLGLALVVVSTALSRRLPRGLWRAIHALSFGTLLLALAHGLTSGSDTQSLAVRAMYLGTSGLLLAAITQRLLLALRPGTKAPIADQAGDAS